MAFFQQGVSNFLIGDFEEALANFNDTLLYLRGNRWINYEQLGLNFKLYSCEVLFNRGLCYIYLESKLAGMGDLKYAAQETEDPSRHDVIEEAIKEEADVSLYTVNWNIDLCSSLIGIHCLLHPDRNHLSAKQRQSEESPKQRLPRKSEVGRYS